MIQWNIAELVASKSEVRIAGNPQIIESKYGKVIEFNGIGDGLFLTDTPLADLKQFTIEVLFYPESGGNFEQRFFHTGEIRGDRVLLEIRTTATDWYFDAFVQSGNQKMTLIDPTMLHPINQWVHVAYVVDHGKLYTYINGQKELEGSIKFSPIQTGKTSIGVRLNEQSWFKGAISQIRISPKALKPKEFLNL
ncbi:MAG: LamG domain-containing protein [Prolixibacteraceae bacterium]|nr:LamG domain-containing protein [Prolixibacteraceae bacterium]